MEPISSSKSSWSVPVPASPEPPSPVPETTATKIAVGPLYGAQVINDAVETSLITIQALADLGIGNKVNHLA
jgi:hypothetical protein